MSHPAVPTALFGSLCLVDAVVIYACLPETSGVAMPDTISDVEDEASQVVSSASCDSIRYGATD